MERNLRKTRIGLVTSGKMDKTIVVSIVDNVKHPLYGKIVKRTYKLKAREALRLATHKLPIKCKVVSRADLEGGSSSEN